MKGFVQDPDAILDYTVDWTDWLDGDEISTSVWILESPITQVPASDSKTTTTATVYLYGGVDGEDYLVTNRITTDGSRTNDRSFTLRIRSR